MPFFVNYRATYAKILHLCSNDPKGSLIFNINKLIMKTKFNGILTLLLAFVVQISFAQEKTISGTVTDGSGPLPGVTVLIKNTKTGTQTNFDGVYQIVANTGDVLTFSY